MERVPHRKRVKHYHEPGDLHELTFSCYRRLPLLTNDDWRRRLARSIDAAGQEESVRLVAFVFMPEHVHLLVHPILPEPRIDRYLARLKQPYSKEIKAILARSGAPLLQTLMVRERPGKTCFRYWQEGPGFDRNLRTARAIAAAIDWKWSSARWHLLDPPWQQDPDLPLIHGLPLGALDRNEVR
jgi:putative transposase